MFNVVTNSSGKPDAVLIRALEPIRGIDLMLNRMNSIDQKKITSGPGKLTKAMGIDRTLNGVSLRSHRLWLEDIGCTIAMNNVVCSKRIGIDYAGKDALLPWRFTIKNSQWISK